MSEKTKWVACHDTLVCAGAKQIQKWCVRVGDEKGPLIAVMLTKDVAHALAAVPDLIAPFAAADNGDWRALDLLLGHSAHGKFWRGVFNEFRAALARAESQP